MDCIFNFNECVMKLEDIANLLAGKINQAHYIKHYLKKAFAKGVELGTLDKENFAIGFAEWLLYQDITVREKGVYIDGEGGYKTTKQLLEIYKKTL